MIKPHLLGFTYSLKYTIMGILLLCFLLFIIAITAVSFLETRNALEESFLKEQGNSEHFLTESILYINQGLKLWDSTYDTNLKDSLYQFQKIYTLSENPSYLNLTAVRNEMNPKIRDTIDLYLINASGVIVQTTYQKDLFLNFQRWPEFFQDITRMRSSDQFVSDRVVRGFDPASPLKKYAYLPTPDHKYLLQISQNVQDDYPEERDALSYDLPIAKAISENSDLRSVLIYNSVHAVATGSSQFPKGKPDERTDAIITQVLSSQSPVTYADPVNKTISRYIFIPAQLDSSPSSKYMSRVGNFTYSTERLDSQILIIFILHLIIALISVIVGIFIASQLAKHLTNPVERIIEDIDRISAGDLNYQVRSTRRSELIHLEQSIAHMVSRLKNHIRYLDESESRYHTLFESSYDPVLLLKETTVIDSNRAAKKIFPELNSTERKWDIGELFHLPEGDEGKDERIQQLIKKGKENGTLEDEFAVLLSDNRVHYLTIRLTLMTMNTANIHLLIQDVTDRRVAWKIQAEDAALKESYHQIQIITDLLPDPTFAINTHGEIILWNHAMEEISKIPGHDVIGRTDQSYALPLFGEKRPTLADLILDPSLEGTVLFPHLTRKGRILSDEITIKLDGDGVVFYSAVACPLYDSNGELIGAVETVRDITSRVMAEKAILRMNQKLNTLSGITRRDIKNRISILNGISSLIKESYHDPESRQLLGMLETSVQAIDEQINFSKDYQDLGVFSPKWQDIGQILEKVSVDLKHEGVTIENNLRGISIYADPLLGRVVYNIIENALQYGGVISRISGYWEREENRLKIIFADDGVGILFIEKEHIFDPGYGKGTGFGLFLAKEVLNITDISITETGTGLTGAKFELLIPSGRFKINENSLDKFDSGARDTDPDNNL